MKKILTTLFLTMNVVLSFACGPFLFNNDELDSLSLLEPGILGNTDFSQFLLYSSPPLGMPSGVSSGPSDDPMTNRPQDSAIVQNVIRPFRVADASSTAVTNLVTDYDSGSDPLIVAENERLWLKYFKDVRHQNWTQKQLQDLLYEKKLPANLDPIDKDYFRYLLELGGKAIDPLVEAKNPRNPPELRERYAFLGFRLLVTNEGGNVPSVYKELVASFGTSSFFMARTTGYYAMTLLDADRQKALGLYLEIFSKYPALRPQVFSSLMTFDRTDFDTYLAKRAGPEGLDALLVRFLIDDRDFSPETLNDVFSHEPKSGPRRGATTLFILYRMVEQVEREAGIPILLNLVQNPEQATPASLANADDASATKRLKEKGMYKDLVEAAVKIGSQSGVQFPRVWFTLAAYLSFYNGDYQRMADLAQKSLTFPAENDAQAQQSKVLTMMVSMVKVRADAWNDDLQKNFVDALKWAKTLDGVGQNRGFYHSLVVLAAQKYLSLDRRDRAVMAFGLVQSEAWDNLYRLQSDDSFWASGYKSNNPVNLLVDALLRDDDLVSWKAAVKSEGKGLAPLEAYFVQHPLLSANDIDYLQAFRSLRRNQPEQALPVLTALEGKNYFSGKEKWNNGSSFFRVRKFSYSLSLDPLEPRTISDPTTVSLKELAKVMLDEKGKAERASKESGKEAANTLVEVGNFWLSLQISGFPLLFSVPPDEISFVGNMEYYGYDGTDGSDTEQVREGAPARDFPLFTPRWAASYRTALNSFHAKDFSAVGKAVAYYQAAIDKWANPDAEIKALLLIHGTSGDDALLEKIIDPRYRKTSLFRELKSSCETIQGML